MKNKKKKVLIFICTILTVFSAYFLCLVFSIKEKFRNDSNEVVDKSSLLEGKGCFYELALPLKDEDNSILVSLDYNYARKVPTISYVKLPGLATVKDE